MEKVKRFEENKRGKDYIVGDLHGCLEDLLLALKAIGFNLEADRLFCVGDLIDRGKDSLETAKLIYKSWFHCAKGNHEQMMCSTVLDGNMNTAAIWYSNGGTWSQKEKKTDLLAIARDLDKLPLVIVVGEGENRFNIVHAELLKNNNRGPVTDKDIDEWTFNADDEDGMTWGRSLAMYLPHYVDEAKLHVLQTDLSLTYCGHTPVRSLIKRVKQMYLDRGCVYFHTATYPSEQNALAIACHQDKVVYEYNPMWKKITKYSYENIETK